METKKTYYDNGNIKQENEVNKDGKPHGTSKLYHENGQLQVEVGWTDGIQNDGNIVSYHENGTKARSVTLLDGSFQGEFFQWHTNGVLSCQGVYKDGEVLERTLWDEDGSLKAFDNETIRVMDEKKNPLGLKNKIYTVPEFASIIRQKFGPYQDLPDAIVVQGFLNKFPMYSDKISNQKVEQSEEDKQREIKGKEHPLRLSESNNKLIHQLYVDSLESFRNQDFTDAIKSLSNIIEIVEKNRDLSGEDPKPIIIYAAEDQSYGFNIADLYFLRGTSKFKSGNNDVLNDFNSALKIKPDHTEALFNRASYYNENNDQEKALNDIEKCLSLKPDDKDFIQVHNDLINSNEKMSETEFLRIQKLYYDSFFYFSPINYLYGDDALKEQAIITFHFNNEFNNYYNYEDGVVWDKIDDHVTLSPSDELISDIEALSNFHKNKICDLIIEIICANEEIHRKDMMMLFTFFQYTGASVDEVPLGAKWENKIGYFPDVRQWDENEPLKL